VHRFREDGRWLRRTEWTPEHGHERGGPADLGENYRWAIGVPERGEPLRIGSEPGDPLCNLLDPGERALLRLPVRLEAPVGGGRGSRGPARAHDSWLVVINFNRVDYAELQSLRAGPQALFVDNRKLALDGCNLRAKRVEFKNTAPGGFAGLKITKNDFRAAKLVLSAPPQAEKQERLAFETCYFRGLEDLDTIRKELLKDALNSETAALVVLKDIRPTPLGLAGTEK
jgi:hypothetical protein